ncbi:Protein kinase [Quillaja saponaria]|uniref:non-specific serine/threonine protein kinase n=1 Tax=Quillaja saponaria TaxID=32244 RepID=A0AAD7PKA1_QUISA|nr:Protein kinase [Quillaja saponaria]
MGTCFGTPVEKHNPAITILPSRPSERSEKDDYHQIGASKGKILAPGGSTNESIRVLTTTSKIKGSKPNLKKFTPDELKSATWNFKPEMMVGEGGFGMVFKGWVEENTYKPSKTIGVGMPIAVKKSDPHSHQGFPQWETEVKFLGKFTHPNLVKLLGHCCDETHFFLVYEYVQRGSLDNYLFGNCKEPLSWNTRLKIAIGAARGLAFLHTSENSVIYRDFKSSNVLLDRAYNPKLSDFGLARSGPSSSKSHVTTQKIGTYGYAAPEYVATGHLYVKSDVYGFGVVLLEILTGLIVFDTNRPMGEHNLVNWAKPFLTKKRKLLRKIMDPRLGERYPITGALEAAKLIYNCLESEQKNRPSMPEVLETLEKINAMRDKNQTRNVLLAEI